jgi:hypothetical protein
VPIHHAPCVRHASFAWRAEVGGERSHKGPQKEGIYKPPPLLCVEEALESDGRKGECLVQRLQGEEARLGESL